MKAILVWGNQLNTGDNSALKTYPETSVIMIESETICRKRNYHKIKITFVLAAMRHFAETLGRDREVYYRKIDESAHDFFDELANVCNQKDITELIVMRPPDRSPYQMLQKFCKANSIKLTTTPNSLFLTNESVFDDWAQNRSQMLMEHFYRWQRKRLGILVENGKPAGGSWNYDKQNRKPLPNGITIPAPAQPKKSQILRDVMAYVNNNFDDHPGSLEAFWLPVTREQSLGWLEDFISNRLTNFGPYEDAIKTGEPFVFHSALSALLNIGLLHPLEVIERILETDAPLQSKEGIVRQIIGWREFIFCLYRYKAANWRHANFFEHDRKLEDWWWSLDRKESHSPILHNAFDDVYRYGYAHHIIRLMVFGNYMLLNRYDPADVYEWFMAMFVDAYEWVMVPNVIGMSQYADGGIDNGGFATKPYIAGGNYVAKMSDYWSKDHKEAQDLTRLYWDFLEHHRTKLQHNNRMNLMYIQLDKRNT